MWASYSLMDFLSKVLDTGKLDTKQAVFEMYYNARQGDPIAIDNFKATRLTQEHYIYGVDNTVFDSDEYKKAAKRCKSSKK